MTIRRNVWLWVAMMTVVMLILAGCSASPKSPADSGASTPANGSAAGATVIEQNFAFNPASLDVKVGDVVTFKNEDSAPHDVEIDGASLGQQQAGASVTWTASKAGSFPFKCTIHPSMTGQITVK